MLFPSSTNNINNSRNSTTSSFSTSFINLFHGWPRDLFHLLTTSPYSMSADGAASAASSSSSSFSSSSFAHSDYQNSVLHFGEREYVVLGFWKMGTGLGLAASMLVVALIAILHEAIVGLRFFLEREQTLLNKVPAAATLPSLNMVGSSQNNNNNAGYVNQPGLTTDQHGTENEQGMWNELRAIFRRTFTKARMLQATLYLVQWFLFIFAFVLVPCGTFNVPLILAAVLGKTAGYLLFIGSPAMESVERIPQSPTIAGSDGPIRLAETRKNLRSFWREQKWRARTRKIIIKREKKNNNEIPIHTYGADSIHSFIYRLSPMKTMQSRLHPHTPTTPHFSSKHSIRYTHKTQQTNNLINPSEFVIFVYSLSSINTVQVFNWIFFLLNL